MQQSPKSYWPLFCLSLFAAVVNFAVPLVLVRTLAPADIGQYKIFFLYLSLAPVVSLTTGLMNGLAYWAGRGEQGLRAIAASERLIVLVGALLAAAALALKPYISEYFEWSSALSSVFAISVFGAVAGTFREEALIVRGHVLRGALFYSGFELLRAAVVLATASIYHDLYLVLLAHLCVQILKVIVSMLGERHVLSDSSKDAAHSYRDALSYAWPISLAAFFAIIISNADQFLLSHLLDSEQFASYAIGCLALSPLYLFEQSVTRVLVPQLSSRVNGNQLLDAQALHSRACLHLAIVMVPATALLVLFAEPLIVLLFTDTYATAAVYLRIFAFTYLALIIPQDIVARARGDSPWILRTFLLFSILALAGTALGAGLFGAIGTLCAIVIVRLGMRAYSMFYVKRSAGWQLRHSYPFSETAILIGYSCLISLAVYLTKDSFGSGLVWMLAGGVIIFAAYLPIALLVERNHTLNRQRPLRVLALLPIMVIGGLERMTSSLALALKNSGQIDLRIFAYDQGKHSSMSSQLASQGIDITLFEKGRGFSITAVLRILIIALNSQSYTIHTHTLGALIYASFVRLLSLGMIKIIHTQHSFVHLAERRRYSAYEKFFTRFTSKVVVVSESLLPFYKKLGLNADRIEVIPNGVELPDNPPISRPDRLGRRGDFIATLDPRCNSTLGRHSNDLWLLYMARLHSGKGQARAIEIWNALPDNLRAQSILLFAGPETETGQLMQLTAAISQAADSERVIYIGGLNSPQQALQCCDLFLSFSEFEGHPLTPVEALGCGMPAIVSDIPGHEFLKEHADLVDINASLQQSAQRISEMLEQIMRQDTPLLRKVSESRAWAAANFDVKAMAGRYQRLYLSPSEF